MFAALLPVCTRRVDTSRKRTRLLNRRRPARSQALACSPNVRYSLSCQTSLDWLQLMRERDPPAGRLPLYPVESFLLNQVLRKMPNSAATVENAGTVTRKARIEDYSHKNTYPSLESQSAIHPRPKP